MAVSAPVRRSPRSTWRRCCHRNTRSPARSRPAGKHRSLVRRDACSRRSGPHARHGLHPRHQADHQAPAEERQNMLFSATFSKEIRDSRTISSTIRLKSRSLRAIRQPTRGAAGVPGRQSAQTRIAVRDDRSRQLAAGAGIHSYQARREPAGQAAQPGRHRRPMPSTATRGRAHVPRHCGLQGRQSSRSGCDGYRRTRPRYSTSCRMS